MRSLLASPAKDIVLKSVQRRIGGLLLMREMPNYNRLEKKDKEKWQEEGDE
jgi:hypothetical protein